MGDEVVGAVGAGVQHEEGRWALGELEPGDAAPGGSQAGALDGGRIHRGVIVVPWVDGSFVKARLVLVPVVFDFVIVQDVDPAEVLSDLGPFRRGIDSPVLLAVVGGVFAPEFGHIGVDKVAEEEHELRAQVGNESREMAHAWDGERVVQGVVGKTVDDARGGEEGESSVVLVGILTDARRRGEFTSVVIGTPPQVRALVPVRGRDCDDCGVVGRVVCPPDAAYFLP